MDNITGKLGYGNMRLPKEGGKLGKLDTVMIEKMIDAFLEAGNSYFDTCYVYDASEKALGEHLVKRYPREQFQINTKMSLLFADKPEDMQKLLDESLSRLGVDYVDYYFLHALTTKTIKKADEFGAWDFLRELKAKGIAKHIGFSFHDSPEVLDDTLSKHPETELVLLQLNYLDWDCPKMQSRKLYETARKYNVPISVMEPCKGGWLASEVSEAGKFLKSKNPDVSVASWAFRYLAELEGISTILSGMGTLSEVEDNIKTFGNFKPLSAQEHEYIKEAVNIINSAPTIPCTDCNYCLPHCPVKIHISHALQIYNNYIIHQNSDSLAHLNYMMGLIGSQPQDCIKCAKCEKVCPQGIEISNYLETISNLVNQNDK